MAVSREMLYQHTRIRLIEGDPLDHLCAALYVAVNARGVMASGLAGAVRLRAGGDVERDLRQAGELLVGQAYPVPGAKLADAGVSWIVCGITTARPGDQPRRVSVVDALNAALDAVERLRVRSLTLPEIGTRVPGIELTDAAGILVDVLVGHLRRGLRLDDVVVAGLHLEYLRACRVALEARGATVVQ